MTSYQVICVDDDEQFLRSLESSLPQKVAPLCPQFECAFEFVASAEELFEMLHDPPAADVVPALVISDQVMPAMTGIELIERLKEERPDLVCVLLTGHAGLESARYAINRRLLDHYAFKPIEDLQEFASLVANLLQRHHLELEERQRTRQLAETVKQLRISNERISAMHAAAEQVAMLAKGLKCLDLAQVVEMVAREVPKIFGAEWGVLCFPENGCPAAEAALIRRHECPCPDADLIAREGALALCRDGQPSTGEVPPPCRKLQARSPNVVIPLTAAHPAREAGRGAQEWRGYLCLCRLASASESCPEATQYKANLVRDVVGANVTNARLYQQARRDSEADPLTGAATRRVLEEKLDAEQDRAARYGRRFCVAIADVDHFKQVNDRLGHAAGDDILRRIAGIMREEIRTTDVLARYGGDEFVWLMPETTLDEAHTAVRRLWQRVEQTFRGQSHPVTVSCGLAVWARAPGDTGAGVLRRADAALYRAKHAGRNRVEIAPDALAAEAT